MRTFFGNISAIFLGLCLGPSISLTVFITFLQLSLLAGLINAESVAEVVTVGSQPQFIAVLLILAIGAVYCAAFMLSKHHIYYRVIFFYLILLQLFNLVDITSAYSIIAAIAVSGQPEFVAVRMIFVAGTLYCAAFVVANLVLSHKQLLAMIATLPLTVIAFLATLGMWPNANSWLDWFEMQSLGGQTATIMAWLSLLVVYLCATWSGAQKGMRAKTPLLFIQKRSVPHLQKYSFPSEM